MTQADPKLIESMAMRYRHDFGMLDEQQKEVIRITMRQLWEEVVGLGFYKPATPVKSSVTAVEWLADKVTDMIHESNHIELVSLLEQAKQMEKGQIMIAIKDSWYMAKGSNFQEPQEEQYYNETYGK